MASVEVLEVPCSVVSSSLSVEAVVFFSEVAVSFLLFFFEAKVVVSRCSLPVLIFPILLLKIGINCSCFTADVGQ
jgi:hypothetical protein